MSTITLMTITIIITVAQVRVEHSEARRKPRRFQVTDHDSDVVYLADGGRTRVAGLLPWIDSPTLLCPSCGFVG